MPDLATIVRALQEKFLSTRATTGYQRKALRAIERCRTALMGGLRAKCDTCGSEHILFRSCRNRACPRCQANARVDWLDARVKDLLPVPYFHVVFTVPEQLNPIAVWCPAVFYSALMRAAGQAILDVGASKLKARLGAMCILHTWGQNLSLHPHVHCVVPGGGFGLEKNHWVNVRKPTFFLPVKVLSRRFRTLLGDQLRQAYLDGKLERLPAKVVSDVTGLDLLLERASQTDWVVYTKPPFGGPEHVLRYLSAYTHRLAISNRRIVHFDGTSVWFRWRDYKDSSRSKTMKLDGLEFIRRFLLHVLPPRFVRIRYVGFLGNRNRAANIDLARQLIGAEPITLREPRERLAVTCPDCKKGSLMILEPCDVFALPVPRGPPALREAS